jgi:hypothetical protein
VMHRPLRQRPGSADSRAEDGGLVAIAQCRLRPDTRQGIVRACGAPAFVALVDLLLGPARNKL